MGHQFPHFLGNEVHEMDHVFGLAAEFFTQHRILGGHAYRAGVFVTGAHHDATQGHQRRRRKAEFFGAQQRGNDDVAAGLELTVGFDDDAAAKVVQHERLVGFRQAQFPRHAGMLDSGQGRGAGAAIVAADQDDIRVGLGDASGDSAHADFGDQLHADARVVVGVFQIVDELGQILDGINIVVRRRGNQTHAGGGMTHLGDPRIDFVSGQLAAFAGLGTLGHLDLQFAGVDEIMAGDAKASGSDLLDGAVERVAVGLGQVAGGIFAAFASVAFAADAVHGEGLGFVGFLADRAVGHGAGFEPFDDGFDWLDFLEGDDIRGELEEKQAAQGAKVFGLVIHQGGVFLEHLVVVVPGGELQFVNGFRVEQVILAVVTPLVLTAGIEHLSKVRARREGPLVAHQHLLRDRFQADALHPGRSPGKEPVNHLLV